MGSVPDHEMVVQFNLQGVGGCFQFTRRLDVLDVGLHERVVRGDEQVEVVLRRISRRPVGTGLHVGDGVGPDPGERLLP